jgi:ribosomal protein S27AE
MKLNSPITDEQWKIITDAELEHSDEIVFTTPSGKKVMYAKVRHGKWIKENIVLTSLPPKSRWHCSECGSIRDGYDGSVLTPYCPNCGARVDLDEVEKCTSHQ